MYFCRTNKAEQYFDIAMDLYFHKGVGATQIIRQIPISRSMLYRWIAKFAVDNPQEEPSAMARKSKKDVQTQPEVPVNEALPDDVIALQKEIKDLRAQLTKAEIKAEAFDELINVAEAQFGIQIRKKAGAKQ